MVLPSLIIVDPVGSYEEPMYSWNFSPEELKKIKLFWRILWASQYGWGMPQEVAPEVIDALVESGLESGDLKGLYSYKGGELVNVPIFGSSMRFAHLQVRTLKQSVEVVEKLSPLLNL